MAYIPIASQTLGSSQASVTFSSIPTTLQGQNLRDLVLVVSAAANVNSAIRMRFNGDTASNYTSTYIQGTSTTASTGTRSFGFMDLSFSATVRTTFGFTNAAQLMDYSATDKHKTVLHRPNDPGAAIEAFVGRWANTSAITNIEVYNPSGTFSAGSTFSLYGVAA